MIRKLQSALPVSRLLWLGGMILATGAIAMAALQAWLVHSERLREEAHYLRSLGVVLAEHTERAIQGADSALRGIVEALDDETLDSPETVKAIYRLMNARIAGAPTVRSATVFDHGGRAVIESGSLVPRPLNIADAEPFAVHRDGKHPGLYISRPTLSRLTGQWSIYLTRRLEDLEGNFAGVAVLIVEPEYFTNFYRTIDLGTDSSIALLSTNGTLMVRYPMINALMGGQIWDRKDAPIPGAPPSIVHSSLDGKERLTAHKELGRYPLAVSVAVSVDEILAPVRLWMWLNVAAGFAIAGLILALFWVLSVQLARREQLASSLRQAKLEADLALKAAVSEQHRAESEQQDKSAFWSSLGHELRSPLSSVIGFAELLQSDALGTPSPQQIEYAGHILESGQNLLGVINEMMDMATIEAGRLKIGCEPVELRPVAEAALEILKPLAQKAGIALHFDDEGLAPVVHGDQRRLRQTLVNLLSNAIKFNNAGGSATLSFHQDDGALAIRITDTGIGMTTEEVAHALTPFGRVAKDDLSKRKPGTGLGLPIANRLTEMQGGRLMVESEHGQGTTVSLIFPPARLVTLGAAPESIDQAA